MLAKYISNTEIILASEDDDTEDDGWLEFIPQALPESGDYRAKYFLISEFFGGPRKIVQVWVEI